MKRHRQHRAQRPMKAARDYWFRYTYQMSRYQFEMMEYAYRLTRYGQGRI